MPFLARSEGGGVMTQHIGIAACSAEGAALCFCTICLEGEALMGEHGRRRTSKFECELGP